MSRACILFASLLFFLTHGAASVSAQVPPSIPIEIPVHGYHVFEADSRLILLDTFSGAISVLDQIDLPEIHRPRWSNQGDRVAYNTHLDVNVINPFDTNQLGITFPYDPQLSSFGVHDWSPDGANLLGIGIDVNSTYYDLQIFHVPDGSRSVLRRDNIGTPLAENPQLEFFQTSSASWNPIFGDWIVAQLETFPIGTENSPERPAVSVGLVINRATGEKHLLNDFLPQPIFAVPPDVWSPDGRELVLETDVVGIRTQIVSVLDASGNWLGQLGASAPDPELRAIDVIGWLNVDDLLLLTERDQSTTEQVVSMGQIINGELHTTEFFRIPITSFSTLPYPRVGRGSWNLTADTEEQYTLSCLFDQALSPQLAIGTRARVNFTTGSPLRLRTEPSVDSSEILQMPEGTEFNIIDGPACDNADAYYRFWQVQLDDGTFGWAAEATNTDYYIEPVPPTPTPSDTPTFTPTFTPTPPPTGGPNQILFASSITGLTELDIYRINPDGTGLTRLTNIAGNDAFPAWSPDGAQIAFASTRDGNYEIYRMNADGSSPLRLTSHPAADEFPAWSPDGTQIAFSSNRDGNWELYVMNADGSNPVNLTNHSADDLYASWSSDGSKIAFSSLRDGNYEVYVVNTDGSNLTRLTNHPGRDEVPNWSPDGSQIAFTSDRAGNLEIYAMNADGSNVQRLTTHAAVDEFPNWSADGSEIVFSSSRSSFFNLFLDVHVMNADGTNVRRLTSAFSFDRFPGWGYP